MNFNIGQEKYDGEYKLFRSTSKEIINLYGVHIKYFITEKINQDQIFGEHSHIKVNNTSIFELYALPSETDMWGGEGFLFSKFGLQNMDTINLFISRDDMEIIHPDLVNKTLDPTIDNIPNGNLVQFDSGKLMEITGFELSTSDVGNNNVFTSDREKNVYKITLKSYIYNNDDFREADDPTELNDLDYESLENIFGSNEVNEEQNTEIEERVNNIEDEIIYPNDIAHKDQRKTPIRDKDKETNPFGILG